MLNLDDIGKVIPVFDAYYPRQFKYNVEVAMVVKGPKGRLALYGRPEKSPQLTSEHQEEQAKVIKAFMEFNNGK